MVRREKTEREREGGKVEDWGSTDGQFVSFIYLCELSPGRPYRQRRAEPSTDMDICPP